MRSCFHCPRNQAADVDVVVVDGDVVGVGCGFDVEDPAGTATLYVGLMVMFPVVGDEPVVPLPEVPDVEELDDLPLKKKK